MHTSAANSRERGIATLVHERVEIGCAIALPSALKGLGDRAKLGSRSSAEALWRLLDGRSAELMAIAATERKVERGLQVRLFAKRPRHASAAGQARVTTRRD